MKTLCIQCGEKPVFIQKRGLCRVCYSRVWYRGKKLSTKTNWEIRHGTEIEFIKNFFTHKNWIYHPVFFRLDGCGYQPDFYDGERNVFIEVSGTKQAFSANFEKYKLFIKTFPLINFEIRDIFGNIKPLAKRAYSKKAVAAEK